MNLLMGDKNELVLKQEEYKYVVPVESPIRDVPDILGEQIPDGSVVLDIGCGQGKYAFLTERGCKLYGIDIEEKAVELALSKNYTDAWCVNIEADEKSGENPQFQYRYDAIILQDVLEHVYDPAKVIIRYSQYLKDDGKILISVPNIAHIDILLHLLNGEFNYGQLGIMDNTHVRFYTKKSFAKMIEAINESGEASLDCRSIGGMFIDSEYCNQYEKAFPKLWCALNGDLRKNGISNLFVMKKVSPKAEKKGIKEILEKTDDVVARLGKLTEGDTDAMLGIYTRSRDSEREWYEYVLESERKYSQNIAEYLTDLKKSFSCAENGWKAAVSAYDDLKLRSSEDVAQKEKEIEALRAQVALVEAQRENKDKQLNAINEQVKLLELDRFEKEKQIVLLCERAAREELEIDARGKQISILSEQINAFMCEREKLIHSTSWRITKPLRSIKNFLTK